jgi:hypothetical protein
VVGVGVVVVVVVDGKTNEERRNGNGNAEWGGVGSPFLDWAIPWFHFTVEGKSMLRTTFICALIGCVGVACSGTSSQPPPLGTGGPIRPGGGQQADAGDAKAGDSGDAGTDGGGGGVVVCPPDIFGGYGAILATGAGCGDLNTSAPQCIDGTTADCIAHFVSAPASGASAVNGDAQLLRYGNFVHATLDFGSSMRTECIGSWDDNALAMSVTCGTGSTLCVVTMTRTGACP